MPTKKETLIIKKATVYDLGRLFEDGGKDVYTIEDINAIFSDYIHSIEPKEE